MKRVISACQEQTHQFETEKDYQDYIVSLDRKRVKYKIVDKQTQSDNTVLVKMIKSYSNYPVADYLK